MNSKKSNEVIFSAPSTPPTFVGVSDINSLNITIKWGPVECIQRNGDITGYSLKYGVQRSRHTTTKNISGGDTTEATIDGLDAATNYSIQVAAVNRADVGAYSIAHFVMTKGI